MQVAEEPQGYGRIARADNQTSFDFVRSDIPSSVGRLIQNRER